MGNRTSQTSISSQICMCFGCVMLLLPPRISPLWGLSTGTASMPQLVELLVNHTYVLSRDLWSHSYHPCVHRPLTCIQRVFLVRASLYNCFLCLPSDAPSSWSNSGFQRYYLHRTRRGRWRRKKAIQCVSMVEYVFILFFIFCCCCYVLNPVMFGSRLRHSNSTIWCATPVPSHTGKWVKEL